MNTTEFVSAYKKFLEPNQGSGKTVEGIGGWVLLILATLLVSTGSSIVIAYDAGYALFVHHSAISKFFTSFELISSLALVFFGFRSLILMVQKKKKFVTATIFFFVLVAIVDTLGFLIPLVLYTQGISALETRTDILLYERFMYRSMILAIVWYVYLKKSRRVHTTFVIE